MGISVKRGFHVVENCLETLKMSGKPVDVRKPCRSIPFKSSLRNQLSGAILESQGIGAIFQGKGQKIAKKGQSIRNFGQNVGKK